MKPDIHPDYVECTVHCSCGNTFKTRSTKSELNIDLCNECHPFYTGQQKFVDTGGRVQRFSDKFGGAAAKVAEREAAKKAERQAKAEQEAKEAAERRAAKKAAKEARAKEYAAKAAKEAEEAAAKAEAEAAAQAEASGAESAEEGASAEEKPAEEQSAE